MKKKVQFKTFELKRNDGFFDYTTAAYVDVTNEAKCIFGDIVKNAILIVMIYDESMGTLEEWKDIYQNQDFDITENSINVDGTSVYITFNNGNIIDFYTSEWGHIYKCKTTPDVLK